MPNSFGARGLLPVGDTSHTIYRLSALEDAYGVSRLPYSLKVLLENLLRFEDDVTVSADDVTALAGWQGGAEDREIAFRPARVLMQDFTGVPAMVDLAAMREAVAAQGRDPSGLEPGIPADLVIDHSVSVDHFGSREALGRNNELDYERNTERYQFLRWGQQAFSTFRVVPPSTGICHQVNVEYLATVVAARDGAAFPDTLVGTDSHTPMVNGLGVVGWGVGGIEAEAALLGQPISMLIPKVVGMRLSGELPEGATATDLVLTVTELLRKHGVVGKFVEFFGPGVANVAVAHRATIGNMSPEYGSTITIFPIDDETLRFLRFTGRPDSTVALVEAYAKEQGLWHDPAATPVFSEVLELDLGTVEPSLAGPARPQDRVPLREARERFAAALTASMPDLRAGTVDQASAGSFPASDPPAESEGVTGTGDAAPDDTATRPAPVRAARSHTAVPVTLEDGTSFEVDHGSVAIAAITSCTNTSNPHVMLAAGLLARKAVERGLTAKPWVKTSLAPGSRVVMDYYDRAGLTPYLEKLGFHLVGYGCTTCIGNSGPLPAPVAQAVNDHSLAVVSVLSGNRNFEGRINGDVRMNYLASPPLVVAYAIAGTMDTDLLNDPLGTGADGNPVYLRDVWPTTAEVEETLQAAVESGMYRAAYGEVFAGDEQWRALSIPTGARYEWRDDSTYVRLPPYFESLAAEPVPVAGIDGARVLAVLGDSVTTDHISPAGAIRVGSPAANWLVEHGVEPRDFNSYGARRGNHEVMIRGTFANPRIRNRLAPGTEGGVTALQPSGEVMPIYDAAMRYASDGVPLVILAGKEYGSGSSRDWAAKGTSLLGVRAVIAESFERIHRSNLIGMGVLPLQFMPGESVESLGLSGRETVSIEGLAGVDPATLIGQRVRLTADGRSFEAVVRIDTVTEAAYYAHGGILQYVLRQHLARA
ncbi:MAG TPA: aconitate hydratase [Frankiaceae bacterium]|nr:aconitate hydratase [Frankiaceae bacterium]